MSDTASSSKFHVMKTKKFKKVPIFIVENHNDVCELLLPSFANNYLPFQNNIIVHFDSHPDCCLPRQMLAATAFNRSLLLESLSIENWLMPLAYMGCINQIAWIKPHFAHQIPNGLHHFSVGEFNDKICVSSSLDYFLSDGAYQKEELLNNKKPIKLYVKEIEDSFAHEMIGDLPWILDIDLDFFSTFNPFNSIYPKADTYNKLKAIFHIEKSYEIEDPESILKYVEERNRHLDFFEKIFQHMATNGSLEKFQMTDESLRDKFNLTKDLIESLCHHYSIYDIDWFLINDAGCTTDDDEFQLPHHESTDVEIKEGMKKLEVFLKGIKRHPEIITISRSSCDGYTPPSQIEMIQEMCLKVLRNVYAEDLTDSPTLWYKNSSEIPALELVEPRVKKCVKKV